MGDDPSCGATADTTFVEEFDPNQYHWGHPLAEDVYLSIRTIEDPEKPYSLEELGVVSPESVTVLCDAVTQNPEVVLIRIRPTNPGCTLATLIGLCIMRKLDLEVPLDEEGFPKMQIEIEPGTHDSAEAITKQLNDKERRFAAMENPDIFRCVTEAVTAGEE